jgi:hypothetical protein
MGATFRHGPRAGCLDASLTDILFLIKQTYLVQVELRLETTRGVAARLRRVSTILSQSGHVFMLVRFVVWFFL